MGTIKNSPFKLDQFIVEEFSISRKPTKQGKIDFGINPSGTIDDTNKVFKLTLNVYIKDSNESFDIKITALGFFEFKLVRSVESLSNYFYTNAPAIIFPYIRAYISSITALSGLKAINLPVMNLSSLKEDLKANTSVEVISAP
ncbi:protein-export chaperone SecB [Mucilaginibacter calamicampi]|uniref:Protein-export chaperone SecB n=1 Tax=Mucilaginibacter calamicampi TaxID=1302352 RepID=A0ABW2YYC0_9SPHI